MYIKQNTLNYWSGFDFPVFVFLVDLNKLDIDYKRYTSIVHGLVDHKNEPFYLVADNQGFKAYVEGDIHTWGFCRDLFFDHLRCQHKKGNLSGVNPRNLGLRGWEQDALYKGVFDQYKKEIRKTYNRYNRFKHLFKS